jgi:hypothetical protein
VIVTKGLGCDCYQQDTDGNCLDPEPCAGDTTLAFDPVTGLAITPTSPSTTPIVTATGWNNGTVNTTNATTTTATTTAVAASCTSTIITGLCDYWTYLGGGVLALWLLSVVTPGGRKR